LTYSRHNLAKQAQIVEADAFKARQRSGFHEAIPFRFAPFAQPASEVNEPSLAANFPPTRGWLPAASVARAEEIPKTQSCFNSLRISEWRIAPARPDARKPRHQL
jgi:hypothetical protein